MYQVHLGLFVLHILHRKVLCVCLILTILRAFFYYHLGSSTNLSTLNSLKSNKNSVESYEANSSAKLRLDQISLLKAENLKLMNEVIESQKTIQSLLKQTLDEQKVQIQLLTNTLEQMNLMDLRSRRDTG